MRELVDFGDVEIDNIFFSPFGNTGCQFFNHVTMRIDQAKAFAVRGILQSHVFD